MRTTFLLIAICLITACGGSKTETNSSVGVLNQYLEIKDALVATDYANAQKAANKMLQSELPEPLKAPVNTIANSSTVEEQRIAFENLSIQMYEMVSQNNHNSTIIYKQFCPMAFNNKGAFWLSTEKQVMNPYFGDMMLHCGSVQETLQQ